MYAVIETGGKQYRVAEGDVVSVEKLNVEAGDMVKFDKVLALSDENGITVGTPYIEGMAVEGKVLENGKGKKVIAYKYKRKSGYHKKIGHRQQYTQVKIEKING